MNNRRQFLSALSAAGLIAALPRPSFAAESLPAPTGKVMLRITGSISNTNAEGAALFDRPMLEAIGMTSVETKTPWFTDRVRFEGVLMRQLMALIGASGTELKVRALNDYASEIPISDFATYDVILALKRNGNYMEISDKGPLFVVYPYDSAPELQSQKYYSRSPWQVAKMEVA